MEIFKPCSHWCLVNFYQHSGKLWAVLCQVRLQRTKLKSVEWSRCLLTNLMLKYLWHWRRYPQLQLCQSPSYIRPKFLQVEWIYHVLDLRWRMFKMWMQFGSRWEATLPAHFTLLWISLSVKNNKFDTGIHFHLRFCWFF